VSVLNGPLEVHLYRGELDQARRLLARYEAICLSSGDVQAETAYYSALAAIRLAEVDPRAALDAAERSFEARATLGFGSQGVKLAYLHALEALAALGDFARVDQLLTIAEEEPVGLLSPFVAAETHRFRAVRAGDDPGADGHFTAAAAQLRALELPFYLAVVLLEHGEWLVDRGRPDDAAPLLAEARETFDRLLAAPWLDRAERALESGREPEPVSA
jgi:hypothetical protein